MMATTSNTARSDRDFAPALWGLQMLVALAASFFIFMAQFGVAGCELDCNFALLSFAVNGFYTFALVLIIASGILLLVLPSRRAGSSAGAWVPMLGIVLTLTAAVIASELVNLSLRQ